MSKSILKNAFLKGLLNLFNIVIPILLMPYIYRTLSSERIGEIEYATTLYFYFGIIGGLGIYNYGLREISKYRGNRLIVQTLYKNLFTLGIVSNLIALLFYFIFIFFFIKSADLALIMIIMGLSFISNIFYVEWANEAFEEFQFITIKTIIIRLLSLIIIILLVKKSADYLIYVSISAGVVLINHLVSFVYVQRKINLQWKTLFAELQWRKFIYPLLLILILNNSDVLYTMLDKTMLGIYCGVKDVAYYSVGQKISDIIKVLLLTITFVSMPRLAFYLEHDILKYYNSIKKVFQMMLLLVFPISIGCFLLSKEIIILFGGTEYLPGLNAFYVFSIRIIVLSIGTILAQQVLFLHGKEKILVIANIICGLLNLILNYIFADVFSPSIAIATTLFTEIVLYVFCLWYIKCRLKVFFNLWNMENLKYFLFSLLFIPTIFIFRSFDLPLYLFISVSIICCSFIYIISLWWVKDCLFIEIRDRMLKKCIHLK